MMRRLVLASMRRQIFLLTILPTFLLAGVAAIRAPLREIHHERLEWAGFTAGRITAITEQLQSSSSPEREEAILMAASRNNLRLEPTVAIRGDAFDLRAPVSPDIKRQRLVEKLTAMTFAPTGSGRFEQVPTVTFRLDDARSFAFHPVIPAFSSVAESLFRSLTIISSVVMPVLLLSWYLSYRLTLPLVEFTAAARRISRDKDSEEQFSTEGAAEIRSLGDSLNVMRSRINRMIKERTSLLRSLGHDLRTPLTRLQMRAERCREPELQRLMLQDITTLSSMIDESMRYLSDKSAGSEQLRKVDLASLLQTITSDYADMNIPVSFSGPRRLVCQCLPRALTRALSNLVDNASSQGTEVVLRLSQDQDGNVIIDVQDDGPGMSEETKKRALEPFFKGDTARTLGPGTRGVGLGLPIASGIAKAHGGTLSLLDREPHGLVARILLPAERARFVAAAAVTGNIS
ncbi:HAMP domain-containing sensor histidine kinase [Mesorhizobium sp. CN2-181]|uniref:sensor histidine kinase n=1 Tax=Mesorhizobium yinganensis TaxID=3157707 RepID=UPI0032B7D004